MTVLYSRSFIDAFARYAISALFFLVPDPTFSLKYSLQQYFYKGCYCYALWWKMSISLSHLKDNLAVYFFSTFWTYFSAGFFFFLRIACLRLWHSAVHLEVLTCVSTFIYPTCVPWLARSMCVTLPGKFIAVIFPNVSLTFVPLGL